MEKNGQYCKMDTLRNVKYLKVDSKAKTFRGADNMILKAH